MPDAFQLTVAQQFELERFNRVIDTTTDVHALQGICKQLLHAWLVQQVATAGAMRPGLSRPPLRAPGV